MSSVYEETATLLENHPEREEALQTLLELDSTQETWTFDDADIDSGTFGDLVSRGIVEKTDGEYRLTNPDAVRAALAGEEYVETDESSRFNLPSVSLSDVDGVLVGSLVSLLLLTVLMRTVFSWGSVFRGEHIVLLGNDPYLYRYWVEELLRTDPTLGGMPQPILDHDVLMIAVMWGAATLLGGTSTSAGLVLSWYPVVVGVLVGLMVYVATVVSFDDRRVGLAALAIYAVTPVAAYRSALGFGDHHAFDYIWVALAVLSLVTLAVEDSDWRTPTLRQIAGAVGIALAIAAEVHSWRGGPLLILPVGVYLTARVASNIRTGKSPAATNVWLLGGLGFGSVLAVTPYLLLGWTNPFRAYAPALLFGGAILVTVVAEAAWRSGLSVRATVGAELVGSGLVTVVAWFGLPAVRSAILSGINYFSVYGKTNIAETYSLLSPALGGFFAPVLFFGLAFFFGLGALLWTSWRVVERDRPSWLVPTTFTWSFLVAALIQLRFAGQLSIVLAVFSGLAFVYLAALTNITELPRPFVVANETEKTRRPLHGAEDQRSKLELPTKKGIMSVSLLFLLVSGMGFVQTPVKTGQLTVDDPTYDAATAINQHATATNLTWPNNYVFSEWGRNRVYNYFVSGHSRSYAYARDHYGDFVTSSNPEKWYRTLSAKQTGYIVMQDINANTSASSMQTRLWQHWGSYSEDADGVGHYRVVYANEERKVFDLVEGAIIVGQGTAGETYRVSTEFKAGGTTHTYERRPTATENGWYVVRVPYSGSYSVDGISQQVPESAVQHGKFVGETTDQAHWPLNASTGNIAFDVEGGHHGFIRGATWKESNAGPALAFDGDDAVVVPNADTLSGDRNFSVSVTFRTQNGTDYENKVKFPRLVGTAPASTFQNASGYQLTLSRGHIFATVGGNESTVRLEGPRVTDTKWHTATLVRDGSVVRLYLDGTQVSVKRYAGELPQAERFTIGSTTDRKAGYIGQIRNVTYNNESVS